MLILLFLLPGVLAMGLHEIGCFPLRPAPDHRTIHLPSTSPAHCIRLCETPVVAIHNGTTCICTSTLPPYPTERFDAECTVLCDDFPAPCGGPPGPATWSTYFIDAMSIITLPPLQPTPPDVRYNGCYKVSTIPTLDPDSIDFDNRITPQMCLDMCAYNPNPDLRVAVTWGDFCYCARDLPDKAGNREELCTTRCSGSVESKCGGEALSDEDGWFSVYTRLGAEGNVTVTVKEGPNSTTVEMPVIKTAESRGTRVAACGAGWSLVFGIGYALALGWGGTCAVP